MIKSCLTKTGLEYKIGWGRIILLNLLKTKIALFFILLIGLNACSSSRQTFGHRDVPDEFLIVSKPPLIIPPEFNLKPVQPGEPDPETILINNQKNTSTLLEIDPAKPSDAEALLLARANTARANPLIKPLLDAESGVQEKSEKLTKELLYGTPDPEKIKEEKAIDPDKNIEINRKKKLPGL